jgi:FkbM family methyltransferase
MSLQGFPGLTKIDGLWWPAYDRRARPALLREVRDAVPIVLSFISERGCIVQAGGNVGLYPIALAEHFETVWTYEPDRRNFDCLALNRVNAPGRFSIEAVWAALGAEPGACDLALVEADNCGTVETVPGDAVAVVTIDALGHCVDAIWLDVEGAELDALKGAERTIRRFSPTIIFEDKGHGPSPAEWLEARGYQEAARVFNDRIFIRGDR